VSQIITFAMLGVSAVDMNLQEARGESPLPVAVRVETDKPGIEIPKTLHGLFFEDLNYAGDGGI